MTTSSTGSGRAYKHSGEANATKSAPITSSTQHSLSGLANQHFGGGGDGGLVVDALPGDTGSDEDIVVARRGAAWGMHRPAKFKFDGALATIDTGRMLSTPRKR